MTFHWADQDVGFIDLRHQGLNQVIAASVLRLPDGVAIIDPGPASTLPNLYRGLAFAGITPADIRAILLTHIHLDHAGATGAILNDHSTIPVFVHEVGARHMVDPSRLIQSAERLYGDAMDSLWGPFLPVPADAIRPLSEASQLNIAGRRIESMPTPGHASHHVSFLDTANGVAFVGDAMGARLSSHTPVIPATPPPDIDVDEMISSINKILAWSPSQVLLTHFGPSRTPAAHAAEMVGILRSWTERVRHDVASGHKRERQAQDFQAQVLEELATTVPADLLPSYRLAATPSMSWLGLARYWRKQLAST